MSKWEGVKIVWAIILVILAGAVLYLTMQTPAVKEVEKSYHQEMVECVDGMVGRSTAFYDWDMARNRRLEKIASDLGLTIYQVAQCQNRWGEIDERD